MRNTRPKQVTNSVELCGRKFLAQRIYTGPYNSCETDRWLLTSAMASECGGIDDPMENYMIPAGMTRMIWALAPNEGVREAMLGDFVEEYDSRVRDEGIAAARRWRCRQGIQLLFDTLRHSLPPPGDPRQQRAPRAPVGIPRIRVVAASGEVGHRSGDRAPAPRDGSDHHGCASAGATSPARAWERMTRARVASAIVAVLCAATHSVSAQAPGPKLVDVGGHKLNVLIAGTSKPGVPTVVFETDSARHSPYGTGSI